MQITTLIWDTDKFNTMPEDERILVTFIGHVRNEVLILEKLLSLSTTFAHTNRSIDAINASQSLLSSKLTAGKLWEGWELLHSFFTLGSKAPKYPVAEQALSQPARDALNQLKNHFADGGVINVLRNQFAFHYMAGNLKKYPPQATEDEPLEIVVTEKDEPFSIFSEGLILNVILSKIEKTDADKAFEKMVEDVMRAAHAFAHFCNECLLSFADKYSLELSRTQHDLPNLEYNRKLEAPFLFSDFTKSSRSK